MRCDRWILDSCRKANLETYHTRHRRESPGSLGMGDRSMTRQRYHVRRGGGVVGYKWFPSASTEGVEVVESSVMEIGIKSLTPPLARRRSAPGWG